MVSDILRLMGQPFDKKILEELIDEVDADSKSPKSIYVVALRIPTERPK